MVAVAGNSPAVVAMVGHGLMSPLNLRIFLIGQKCQIVDRLGILHVENKDRQGKLTQILPVTQ